MTCWSQRTDQNGQIVTKITTHCNQGIQKSIPEYTTHWTLKQMGWSSRKQLGANPATSAICSGWPFILYDHSVQIFWRLLPAGEGTMSKTSDDLKLATWTWQWLNCARLQRCVVTFTERQFPPIPKNKKPNKQTKKKHRQQPSSVCFPINIKLINIKIALYRSGEHILKALYSVIFVNGK